MSLQPDFDSFARAWDQGFGDGSGTYHGGWLVITDGAQFSLGKHVNLRVRVVRAFTN